MANMTATGFLGGLGGRYGYGPDRLDGPSGGPYDKYGLYGPYGPDGLHIYCISSYSFHGNYSFLN